MDVIVKERGQCRKVSSTYFFPLRLDSMTSCFQLRTDSRLHELPPSDSIGWHARKPPPELEPSSCTSAQHTPKFHRHLPDTCPLCLRFDMWCSRSALRRLQQVAVTPLNITGAVTGNMQRGMSTLPRVYVTRQIPPEGLKILRESGQ